MKRRMILTFALSTLALIPPACVVESSSDKDNGGESGGGTAGMGGAALLGGSSSTTHTGGVTATTPAAGAGAANTITTVANAGATSAVAGAAGALGTGGAQSGGAGGATLTNNAGVAGTSVSTTVVVRTPVQVTDDIQAYTHWTADHVYIVSGTLYVSAAFTIDPGTIVKFAPNAGINVQSGGQLNAVGTSAQPIVFTSLRDDTGGDTNQDTTATQPGVGDWSGIQVSGNSSKFEYSELRYSSDGLGLDANSLSVKNSTFSMNASGLDASGCDASLVITGNVFYSNTHPIYVDANIAVDSTNSFHAPSNAATVNKYQCIFIEGDINQAVAWTNTESAYCVNGTLYVSSASALTLASGVVVKFAANSGANVQAGSSLVGSATAIFTSYKDDAHLGDSNGDGAVSTPAEGDWESIYVTDTDTVLSGANVLYSTPDN